MQKPSGPHSRFAFRDNYLAAIGTAVLVLVSFLAQAQKYQYPNPGLWGTQEHRRAPDSTFYFPTGCGIPTDSTWLFSQGFGAGQKLNMAAKYYDSCGHHEYVWDPSLKLWHISDSTSARGIDTLYSRSDSAFYQKDSVERFAFLLGDSLADRSVTLAKLATGTPVSIISYDAFGIPALISSDTSLIILGDKIEVAHSGVAAGHYTNPTLDIGQDGRLTWATNGTGGSDSTIAGRLGVKVTPAGTLRYIEADSLYMVRMAHLYAALDSMNATIVHYKDSAGTTGFAKFDRLYKVKDSILAVINATKVANFAGASFLGYGTYAAKPTSGSGFYYAQDSGRIAYINSGVLTWITDVAGKVNTIYFRGKGQPGDTGYVYGRDSFINVRAKRDSGGYHHTVLPDSSEVDWALDSTGVNALATKYDADTMRTRINSQLGSGGSSVANSTAVIGVTRVTGVATTAKRSDASDPIDTTATGIHTLPFNDGRYLKGSDTSTLVATPYGIHNTHEFGVIYNGGALSGTLQLTDFQNNGATTPTIDGSGRLVTTPASAGTSSQSIDIKGNGSTCLEYHRGFISFYVGQAPASTTYGDGFGIRPNTLGQAIKVYVQLDMRPIGTGTGGYLLLEASYPSSVVVAQSATPMTCSNGDHIEVTWERYQNIYRATAYNATTGAAPIIIADTYFDTQTISGSVGQLPNSGFFSIYTIGGSFPVDSINIYSKEKINPSVVFWGDSKFTGYYAGYTNSLQKLTHSVYVDGVLYAGSGNRSSDLVNDTLDIIRMKPWSAVLDMGTNDPDSNTFKTNLGILINFCIRRNIVLYHTVLYNGGGTGFTMANGAGNLWRWNYIKRIIAPQFIINTWDPLHKAGTLVSDSVHPNSYGGLLGANAVLAANIPGAKAPVVNVLSTPPTFDQVLNSGPSTAIAPQVTGYKTTSYAQRWEDIFIQPYANNNAFLFHNGSFDGTNFKYYATGTVEGFQLSAGQLYFGAATSGSAGGTVSLNYSFKTDYTGAAGIGGNISGTIGSYTGAWASFLSTGITFTKKLTLPASTTGAAPFNIPSGTGVTSPANGDIWQTGGHVYMQIAGSTVQLDQPAGTSPPFSDATALVNNSSDATKLLKLSSVNISTATTRTLTAPDFDGIIAVTNHAQTITGAWDMTGATVTVATQSPGDNTTKPASTAFVTAAVAAGGGFINPMTTLGDILYQGASVATRLAGVTSAARGFLISQGTGSAAQAPIFGTLVSGDIPNNAANTTGSAASLSAASLLPAGTTVVHIGGSGSAPAQTSLGSNVTSITVTGNDNWFKVTIVTSGAVSGTIGSIGFATTWTSIPVVVICPADYTTANNTSATILNAVSTTSMTMAGTIPSSGTYIFNCHAGN